jgi:hypothetical protein
MMEKHFYFDKNYLKMFLMTGLFLVILISLSEIFLRLNPINKYQLVPYLGSSHRQLEIQLERIQSFAEAEGQIDCLFIGSSMVWLGINPELFSQTYKDNTGEKLSCFNFGVATMPASAAGIMAEILVDKYHPRILLFGTSPRDYAIPIDSEDAKVILDTTWVQYQRGKFSLQGWLYSNSSFYGNLENLNRLMRLDKSVITDIGTSEYDRYGFLPKTRPILEENIQAGIDDAEKWLTHYEVLEENIDGLEQIAIISEKDVQVIIFVTPVQSSYYDYFQNGEQDLDKFVQIVEEVSTNHEIPFIRMPDSGIIPVDGWWNENHLNLTGANAFSAWLAGQVSLIETH